MIMQSERPLGTVYRNTVPNFTNWVDNDMMEVTNGAYGITWPNGNNPPHPVGIFGLVQAWTGIPQPALYAAHDQIFTSLAHVVGAGNSVTDLQPDHQ